MQVLDADNSRRPSRLYQSPQACVPGMNEPPKSSNNTRERNEPTELTPRKIKITQKQTRTFQESLIIFPKISKKRYYTHKTRKNRWLFKKKKAKKKKEMSF